jgi:hypothetical protein
LAERESWHLDKRVPISLIATLVVQTGAIVWWASRLDIRVTQLEAINIEQKVLDSSTSTKLTGVSDALTRLDVTTEFILESQQEMKTDIRALLDKAD